MKYKLRMHLNYKIQNIKFIF